MSAEACDVIALAMEQSQYVISDDRRHEYPFL